MQEVLEIDDAGGQRQFAFSVNLRFSLKAGSGIVEIYSDNIRWRECFDVFQCVVGTIPMKAVEYKAYVSYSDGANQFFSLLSSS